MILSTFFYLDFLSTLSTYGIIKLNLFLIQKIYVIYLKLKRFKMIWWDLINYFFLILKKSFIIY